MRDHGTDFETILQHCLERLERGGSVQACLRDFPDQAEALAPLLAAADALRWCPLPPLSDATRVAVRAQALAAFARQAGSKSPQRSPWRGAGLRVKLLALACAVVLVVGGLGISVAAAQASLPGSLLYGLKRESEQVRLQLARSPHAQSTLYLDFATRRLDEALALAASGRTPERELVTALVTDYTQAWQTIGALPAAEQAALRRQYAAVVQTHQERLTRTLASSAMPAVRAVLAPAMQASQQAGARAAASILPTALASPSSARTGGAPPAATLPPTPVAATGTTAPPPTATALPAGTATTPPAVLPAVASAAPPPVSSPSSVPEDLPRALPATLPPTPVLPAVATAPLQPASPTGLPAELPLTPTVTLTPTHTARPLRRPRLTARSPTRRFPLVGAWRARRATTEPAARRATGVRRAAQRAGR